MLGLGVASSPRIQAAPAAQVSTAAASASSSAPSAAVPSSQHRNETGSGWGSMIGCAACAVAAGVVASGGPGAILIAVNAPGSAVALMACAAVCYEAFQ